jgi:hypothetical protein
VRRVAFAVLAVSVLVSGTLAPAVTEASWTDDAYTQVTGAAGIVSRPPTFTCQAAAGNVTSSIPMHWTAPATTNLPTGWLLSWSGSGGSGTHSYEASALSGAVPHQGLTTGTITVVLYALYNNWTSEPSVSRTISLFTLGGNDLDYHCT